MCRRDRPLPPLSQDERQVRQRDDLARMVESLEKAWAKLKHTHA